MSTLFLDSSIDCITMFKVCLAIPVNSWCWESPVSPSVTADLKWTRASNKHNASEVKQACRGTLQRRRHSFPCVTVTPYNAFDSPPLLNEWMESMTAARVWSRINYCMSNTALAIGISFTCDLATDNLIQQLYIVNMKPRVHGVSSLQHSRKWFSLYLLWRPRCFFLWYSEFDNFL